MVLTDRAPNVTRLVTFAEHAYAGLDACVHCGFCLPACPTYEVTSDESDSPRGRIVLMRALAAGTMSPADDALATHLDRCLGCRACESACPAGVIFGPALEASRATLAKTSGISPVERVMLWLLAYPHRQKWFWMLSRLFRRTGLARLIARGAGPHAPRLAGMLAMLDASSPLLTAGPPDRLTAGKSAALFRGCVMDGLFSHVHDATITVLGANGVGTVEVKGQACCGALAAHAGNDTLARELARANVAAFDAAVAAGHDIVVNSAGCGAMLEAYGEWLAGEPLEARARALAARVRDVSEVLAEHGPVPGTRAVPLTVAYDAPCHLLHAQRVSAAPHRVLAAVRGATLVPLEGSDRCCGAAGLYALVEQAMSQDVLDRKLDQVAAAAPDVVATGNPGCLMQIGGGLLLRGAHARACHPVELLARSYAP